MYGSDGSDAKADQRLYLHMALDGFLMRWLMYGQTEMVALHCNRTLPNFEFSDTPSSIPHVPWSILFDVHIRGFLGLCLLLSVSLSCRTDRYFRCGHFQVLFSEKLKGRACQSLLL